VVAVKTGLIGYGFHGQTLHQAAQLTSDLEIVAALDPNKELHLPIQTTGARPYSVAEEFFAFPGLEAVIVASPVSTHAEMVGRAVEARLAVSLEKPMALTHEESLALADMARRSGIPLMIGMTTHYRPEMIFRQNR